MDTTAEQRRNQRRAFEESVRRTGADALTLRVLRFAQERESSRRAHLQEQQPQQRPMTVVIKDGPVGAANSVQSSNDGMTAYVVRPGARASGMEGTVVDHIISDVPQIPLSTELSSQTVGLGVKRGGLPPWTGQQRAAVPWRPTPVPAKQASTLTGASIMRSGPNVTSGGMSTSLHLDSTTGVGAADETMTHRNQERARRAIGQAMTESPTRRYVPVELRQQAQTGREGFTL